MQMHDRALSRLRMHACGWAAYMRTYTYLAASSFSDIVHVRIRFATSAARPAGNLHNGILCALDIMRAIVRRQTYSGTHGASERDM